VISGWIQPWKDVIATNRRRYTFEKIFAVVKLNQLATSVPDAYKLGVADQRVYH